MDYPLVKANSGSMALEIIEEKKPDLVLLDIMMPDMSGIELCKKLRESYTKLELPIIFQTAKDSDVDLQEALLVGGNDYIAKPFSKIELISRIENHFNIIIESKTLPENVIQAISIIKDTIYIKTIQNYSYFYSEKNMKEIKCIRIALNEMAIYLGSKFVRINKSYLINRDNIRGISFIDKSLYVHIKPKLQVDEAFRVTRTYQKNIRKNYPDLFY